MAKGTKGKKRSQSGGGGGVDDRFASARFDPRFSRFPAKKKKKDQDAGKAEGGRDDAAERAEAEEDPRFSDILKRDKRFAVGTSALKVDKRGRERPGKREKEDAAPREADEEGRPSSSESDSDGGELSDSGSSSFEDVTEEEAFRKKRIRAVERFGIGAFAGRYLDDDELDDQDLEENEDYKRLVEGERCQLDEATSRVAVVDLDWQNFTACDILAVLRSFVPPGGPAASDSVRRVTVYKSDYGIERMKVEDKEGPGAFFKGYGESSGPGDEGSDDSEESDSESSDGKEIDKDALRAYERSKLRYYFAIAEFADKKIAKFIYDACDGLEFDRSSSRFDLRFVGEGDGVEKDRPVRDEARDVPVGYSAPTDGGSFYNSAIQHTNVSLTWDQENKKRRNIFKEQFQKFKNSDNAVMDADIAAYLASDSSSGESGSESEETKRQKFRSALNLGGPGASGRSKQRMAGAFASRDWAAEEEKDVDMVVAFDSGIDALGERLREKHERIKSGKGDLTVWEKALEEKRRKKKSRRERSDIEEEEEEVQAAGDDAGFDDPFFDDANGNAEGAFDDPSALDFVPEEKKKKRKKDRKGREDGKEKPEAELDLLLTSDAHLKALSSGHRVLDVGDDSDEDRAGRSKKGKKKKKKKKRRDEGKESKGSGFEMNMEDPRFSKMYSSREFALDPTEPQYKQLPENLVKKFHSKKKLPEQRREGGETQKDGNGAGHLDLSSAVASLKRKLKQRSAK